MNENDLLIQVKKSWPHSILFFTCFVFFKSLGWILITNAVNKNERLSNDSTKLENLKAITFIPDWKRQYNQLNINLLFYAIYVYLLIILSIIIYLRYSIRPVKTNLITLKDKSTSKTGFKSVPVFTLWVTIYVFISQYFLEILSLPWCIQLTKWIPWDKIKPNVWDNLSKIEQSWYIPIYVTLLINVIVIALTNYLCYHYIKWWNNMIISTKTIIAFIPNKKIILMFTFLQNWQMIHYYGDILVNENNMLIVLHIASIAYCLAFQVWLNKYVSDTKSCNILFYVVSISGVVSSVLSLIINYTVTINLKITYFKWIVSWLLTALLCVVIINRKKRYMYNILPSIWFKRQSSYNFLTDVIFLLSNCLSDISIWSDFIVIIQNHKRICVNTECDCHEIDLDEWCRDFKSENGSQNVSRLKDRNKFYSVWIWIENELQNLIKTAYKSKKMNTMMHLVIIQCCFMTHFKSNHVFSLYLLEQYWSRFHDMALEYKVSIWYHKSKVMKRYSQEQHCTWHSELFLKGETFIKFVTKTQMWKTKMTKFMSNFSKVLKIKQTYVDIAQKKQINFNDKNKNTEVLFKHCRKMELAVEEISAILIKSFKRTPLINLEVCYLLTHFFDIYQGEIPSELRGIVRDVKVYNMIKEEKNLYLQQKFTHPLIFNLATNGKGGGESMSILYCSNKWLHLLKYNPSEVLNHSINTLLPPLFAEKHSLVIQKTTLWDSNEKMKKESIFLWTKDSYYIKASFTMSTFPTINSGILFIWDIKSALDDISGKDNKDYSYVFITDKQTNIISMSESFTTKYLWPLQVIKEFKIPFTAMLGINRDKLLKQFERDIKSIEWLNLNLIGKVSNILKEVKWKEMKLVYKDVINETTKNRNYNPKQTAHKENTVFINKSKKQLLYSFRTIRKEIEEKEYENECIEKIRFIENKIMYDLDNDTCFCVCVKCKRMGNLPYFFITLEEIKDKSIHIDSPFNISRSWNPITSLSPSMNWDKIQGSCIGFKSTKRVLNFIPCKMEIPHLKVSPVNSRLSSSETSNRSLQFDSTNTNLLGTQEINKKTNNLNLIEISIPRRLSNRSQNRSNRTKRDMIIAFPNANKWGKPLKNEISANKNHSPEANESNNKTSFISIALFCFSSLCVASLSLILTSMFTKSSKIIRLSDIGGLNIQAILFKEMLYEISSSILSGCFRTDKFEYNPYFGVDFPTEQLKKNMYTTSSKFYSYFMYIEDFVNKYHYIEETKNIFDLVYGKLNVVKLYNTWNYSLVNTTYENEINTIHIDSGIFRNDNTTYNCLIEKAFLYAKFAFRPMDEEANSDAVRFFYILGNLQKAITERTDWIIVNANQLQVNYNAMTRRQIYEIDISWIIIMILMVATFEVIIQAYNMKIKGSVCELSLSVGNIGSWERKISAFVKIVSFFDEDNLMRFEKGGWVPDEKGWETISVLNGQRYSIKVPDINEEVKKKNNRKSQCGNDHWVLAAKGKQRNSKMKSARIINDDDTNNESDAISNNIITRLNISIRIITISNIISALSFIVWTVLSLVIIFEDDQIFDKINQTKDISTIYLSAIPRFTEITIYYKLSVWLNDREYVELKPEDYYKFDYTSSEVFKSGIDYSKDSRFMFLNNSKMAFLYYKLTEDLIIMKNYNQDSNWKVLKKSREFQASKSCAKIAEEYARCCLGNDTTLNEGIIRKRCEEWDNGKMKNGILWNWESSANFVIDHYIEFYRHQNSDLETFWKHDHYLLAVSQIQNVYRYEIHAIGTLILEDIDNLFKDIIKMWIIMQLLELVLCIVIVCVLLLVLLPKTKIFNDTFRKIIWKVNYTLLWDQGSNMK